MQLKLEEEALRLRHRACCKGPSRTLLIPIGELDVQTFNAFDVRLDADGENGIGYLSLENSCQLAGCSGRAACAAYKNICDVCVL